MLYEMYLRFLHVSKKHWIVFSSASAAPYTVSPYKMFGSAMELNRGPFIFYGVGGGGGWWD